MKEIAHAVSLRAPYDATYIVIVMELELGMFAYKMHKKAKFQLM